MKFFSKRLIIVILVFIALIGLFLVISLGKKASIQPEPELIETEEVKIKREIIGRSVEGRAIESFTFLPAEALAKAGGGGENHLLFVGGIHGGYEWNSVLLAYEFIDYFEANPEAVPDNLAISIIPSLNPDGVYKIIGREGRFNLSDGRKILRDDAKPGRFNANEVDLNRNFDCKWQTESMWQGNVVSAGTAPFSEPEARALRDFVLKNKPNAVVFWHSRANAVYASECEEGILPATRQIMNAYSKASGYTPVDSFDHYEITGDAEGWLSSIGIPAITVELETYENIEWQKNLAGVMALFSYYK